MSRLRGCACALVVATMLAGCAARPDRPDVPIGSALALQDALGRPFDPNALKGHVVLITFLASYCVPCLSTLPMLRDYHRDYAPRGLEMVAIGMDLEGRLALEPFAQTYALPFPLLIADPQLREGRSEFGPIRSLPSTILIGKDGKFVVGYEGIAPPEQVREVIERALAE